MEGLSLRPKGAAALLHRRGESPLRLNARRGLTRRKRVFFFFFFLRSLTGLCLRDCTWCTYSYTTINLINPFARTITPVWSVLAGPRSVQSYRCNWNVQCVTSSTAEFNCRIQICFHASAGAEPDQTRWAFVILSQPFNVFNRVMLILGFRHLNTHEYKQNPTFIVCEIHADFYENGNNDHYQYNVMTCFIDIIHRLRR